MLYIEFHFKLFDRSGADIRNFGGDLSSGQLLHQQGGTLEGIDLYVGIHAALEAERRIGVQAEALGRLAHPDRVEIGALDEHIRRSFGRTGIQSAEHTGNAHRFFFIADHQVAFVQFTLHAIKSYKRSTSRHGLYNHLTAFNLICIEAVQRLAESMDDIVGNIHHIIDRTQADNTQLILQPFGAFFHCNPFHRNAGISGTCLAVLYSYFNIQIVIFYRKSVYRRFL